MTVNSGSEVRGQFEYLEFDGIDAALGQFQEAIAAALQRDQSYLVRQQQQAGIATLPSWAVLGAAGPSEAFDAVALLIEEARSAAARVPQQLEREAEVWAENSRRLGEATHKASELGQIEGWAGAAAMEYSQAAFVQAGALQELAGVASSIAAGLRTLALLNRSLFAQLRAELRDAEQEVRTIWPTDFNYCANYVSMICGGLRERLRQILEATPVEEAGEELARSVDLALSSASLLRPGQWPSAASAFIAAAPGDTATVPDPAREAALPRTRFTSL